MIHGNLNRKCNCNCQSFCFLGRSSRDILSVRCRFSILYFYLNRTLIAAAPMLFAYVQAVAVAPYTSNRGAIVFALVIDTEAVLVSVWYCIPCIVQPLHPLHRIAIASDLWQNRPCKGNWQVLGALCKAIPNTLSPCNSWN